MTTCEACGSAILFGAVREGQARYCNARCRQRGAALAYAASIPEYVVDQQVRTLHAGLCPHCGGAGPVDVHTSYRVWSLVFITSWVNTPRLGCRACGRRGQITDLVVSLLCGWWGLPWGLVMTPVQIVRNIGGIVGGPDPSWPSAKLVKLVRIGLGTQAMTAAAKTRAA